MCNQVIQYAPVEFSEYGVTQSKDVVFFEIISLKSKSPTNNAQKIWYTFDKMLNIPNLLRFTSLL